MICWRRIWYERLYIRVSIFRVAAKSRIVQYRCPPEGCFCALFSPELLWAKMCTVPSYTRHSDAFDFFSLGLYSLHFRLHPTF
jgi:hypothetical protein